MDFVDYDLTLTDEQHRLRDATALTIRDGENAYLAQIGATYL